MLKENLGKSVCQTCAPKTSEPCYSGGIETENKGICKPGLRTCTSDREWGGCVGEVLPKVESCNNQDDNCNGQVNEGLKGCVGTYAGSGMEGHKDGVGTEAMFATPKGVAVDKKGNLYITDARRIRKVDSQGNVTTIAGNGSVGNVDGNGSEASFVRPFGITVDQQGNVYVTDVNAHRIRKIDPQNIVSTVAGGRAGDKDGTLSEAEFNFPQGIVVNPEGKILYVADTNNHKVRKIDLEAGMVTTIVVQSKEKVGSQPQGITMDSLGSIYFTDEKHVYKIDSKGGVVTLVGDERKDFKDGPAQFDEAIDLAVDQQGNIYIADNFNRRVRKIDPQGNVTTLAGSSRQVRDGPFSVALFDAPTGVAIDSSGKHLFVAGNTSNRIRLVMLP